jgi:hypothetical protein
MLSRMSLSQIMLSRMALSTIMLSRKMLRTFYITNALNAICYLNCKFVRLLISVCHQKVGVTHIRTHPVYFGC